MSLNNPNSLRLQQALDSCSQSIANGDFKQSDESVSSLVQFLDSLSNDEPQSEDSAFEALSQMHQYLISPSLDQAVIDALAFELPKAAAKLGRASVRCFEYAERIINHFVTSCSPRDMVSILCEAMTSSSDGFDNASYFTPLLGALAKVFEVLQRRPFEQVKAALPVVLKVLETVLSNPEDVTVASSVDLLNKSVLIAHSLNTICIKLDQKDKKLIALFGLYILQITALISNSVGAQTSICFPMMLQLPHFLHYCGLTYLGLITGHEVDTAIDLLSQGSEDDYISCFSYVRCGAALTVLWGDLSNEVGDAKKQDLKAVKDELSKNQTKRWKAVGMLKHIFASTKLPWELKRHAIDFLFSVMEGVDLPKDHDEPLDSVYIPSLYASLQAIQLVIVYASDPLLRKKAFVTFKMVLADLPSSSRFEILMALTRNSELSSMIAILLDCVKEEMHKEYPQKPSKQNESLKAENNSSSPFWTDKALDFVEFVLKPPHGGPPILPEFTDAVLSALNLYRFILISESSGNTNYSQVLSKNKLQKVYKEWLEPLRALVYGVKAENHEDNGQPAFDTLCGLNPVEFVLYRCIELIEENLKHAI
ncbi:aberrant root formation protein 4-like [Bidens hawaiensis]|uniref:aberrant root formation protein 4-like n=1 Tax=Bidens hawaiensis TaxID=980011 RepID=UPI00404B339F